jgi:hypothetical protein
MPSSDTRQQYLRNTIAGFTTLTVPQSFLDNRPLVKTEATDEADAVYYTEADGLTFFDAMKLYRPSSVGFYDESGDNPELLTTLDNVETPADIPAEADVAFYGLHEWTADETADAVRQADALGVPVSQMLFPWGAKVQEYLNNGI